MRLYGPEKQGLATLGGGANPEPYDLAAAAFTAPRTRLISPSTDAPHTDDAAAAKFDRPPPPKLLRQRGGAPARYHLEGRADFVGTTAAARSIFPLLWPPEIEPRSSAAAPFGSLIVVP